jgi:hypothetical protein
MGQGKKQPSTQRSKPGLHSKPEVLSRSFFNLFFKNHLAAFHQGRTEDGITRPGFKIKAKKELQ